MNHNFRRRNVCLLLVVCFCGCTQKQAPPRESKAPDQRQSKDFGSAAEGPTREKQRPDGAAESQEPEPASKAADDRSEPAPSAANSAPQPHVVHADFRGAFTPGQVFKGEDGERTMRQVTVASLVVKSGKLVAADPATIQFEEQRRPFNRKIEPGKYPVTLALARFSGGDERCACVRLEVKDAEAVRWEMATRTGEKLESLRDGEMFTFGVDSGQACFVDAEAIDSIDNPGEYERMFFDELLPRINKHREMEEPAWGEVAVGETGANLVGFDAGYGDGAYASFWGFDEGGDAVQLVIDFGLLTETVRSELVINRIAGKLGKPIQHDELAEAGIVLRITPQTGDEHKLDVVIEGARAGSCRLVLVNGDQRHDSRSVGTYKYDKHKVSYTLEISSPVREDAKLELRFTKGSRPL
jgi:hypothetical protein